MTIPAVGNHEAQLVVLTTDVVQASPLASQLAELVVYAPPPAHHSRTEQAALMVPMTTGVQNVPNTTQAAVLIVYTTGVPNQTRGRSWTFVLDGHTMYVLPLGPEGTFIYDTVTQQWSQFDTYGYGQWNFNVGTMWGEGRIVGGDTLTNQVWELDPAAVFDEGWRDIQHIVSGGLSTRSRKFVSCDALRIAASIGKLDDVNGATFTLTFSDDWGDTWSDPFTVQLTNADYGGEIAWRSLGSFMAPGRIFELMDFGGLIRIDGADVFVEGFDEDPSGGQQKPEG